MALISTDSQTRPDVFRRLVRSPPNARCRPIEYDHPIAALHIFDRLTELASSKAATDTLTMPGGVKSPSVFCCSCAAMVFIILLRFTPVKQYNLVKPTYIAFGILLQGIQTKTWKAVTHSTTSKRSTTCAVISDRPARHPTKFSGH